MIIKHRIILLPYFLVIQIVMFTVSLSQDRFNKHDIIGWPFREPKDLKQPPQETSVASSPVIFAQPPNWNQQAAKTNDQTRGFPPTTMSGNLLRAPVNTPLGTIGQEEARQLEQFMRDYPRTDQTALNLASINDRGTNPPMNSQSQMPVMSSRQYAMVPIPTKQQGTTLQQRSDNLAQQAASGRHDYDARVLTRKGKVDDVVLFNNLKNKFNNHVGLKKLIQDGGGDGLPPGCIARSAPHTSRCEDHLIKRLSQDATEGRTVLDVTRRVCCALFWHKDCISRVVIEMCPDSNPPAADILLGSRNLDLTLSCQRFNRDGCNGGPINAQVPSFVVILLITLVSVFGINFHNIARL